MKGPTGQRRSVRILASAAVSVRLFCLVTLDEPFLLNAGWLTVLAGGAAALPALIPVLTEPKRGGPGGFETLRKGGGAGRAAAALLGGIMLYDAAVSAQLLTMMAEYVMMTDLTLPALLTPLMLAVLSVCLMGADAVCAVAVMSARVGLILAALLALSQLGQFEPDWLRPMLGPGLRELLSGAARSGGLTAALTLAAYVLGGQAGPEGRRQTAGALIIPVLLAAGALAVFSMLVPSMPNGSQTRLFRLEALLDNGQTGLSMELAYVVVLLGGLLLTVMFETLAASACLELVCGRIGHPVCTAVSAAAVTAIVCAGWAGKEVALRADMWLSAAAGGAAALSVIAAARGQRR